MSVARFVADQRTLYRVPVAFTPGQVDPQVREVHLALRARLMGLWHVRVLDRLTRRGPDLRAPLRDVVPHPRVAQISQLMLIDQPSQNPAGGVPLLARSRQIGRQHPIDQTLCPIQLQSRPDRGLPLRWHHVPQRLPDGPPVDPHHPARLSFLMPCSINRTKRSCLSVAPPPGRRRRPCSKACSTATSTHARSCDDHWNPPRHSGARSD